MDGEADIQDVECLVQDHIARNDRARMENQAVWPQHNFCLFFVLGKLIAFLSCLCCELPNDVTLSSIYRLEMHSNYNLDLPV